MKNQIMEVKLKQGVLHIGHKTKFGSLTDMFNMGNQWRVEKKKSILNPSLFMGTKRTKEFIKELELELGYPAIKSTGKGSQSRTEAHIYFLIYVAEHFSVQFHLEVIKTFVEGKLLQYREEGGEEFKRFNEALLDFLPSPRSNDNARRINAAKLIREKCELTKPEDEELETWNQEAADVAAQVKRLEILDKLTTFLRMGFVRDFDHLKELIEKL